jgi:hypothetical protein
MTPRGPVAFHCRECSCALIIAKGHVVDDHVCEAVEPYVRPQETQRTGVGLERVYGGAAPNGSACHDRPHPHMSPAVNEHFSRSQEAP